MKAHSCWLLALGLALALAVAGCGSTMTRTHEGSLIDDKVTAQRVSTVLRDGGPDFRGVRVKANKGVVELNGTVPSAQARERAEALARGLPDVNGVQDNLVVQK